MRLQLVAILKAVISQRLVPRADGKGRVPALEVLISTALHPRAASATRTAPRSIPRRSPRAITTYGMQTFDQSIFYHYKNGLITYDEALKRCSQSGRVPPQAPGHASSPSDVAQRGDGILTERHQPGVRPGQRSARRHQDRLTPPVSDPGCWSKALDLLSRRPHFRRELEAKLTRRGFSGEAVTATLDRLVELKLLDDRSCAKDLVDGALRRRGYGPARIRAELVRKGAPEDVVDEILAAANPADELSLAREASTRWLRGKTPAGAVESRKARERLARHLARKGFTTGVILRVLEDLPEPSNQEQS